MALRDQGDRWQRERGIAQWRVGERDTAQLAPLLPAGALFVVEGQGTVIATAACRLSDPPLWGADDGLAVHAGNLIVALSHRGLGLGAALIGCCAKEADAAGRGLVRLSCLAGNSRLRGCTTASVSSR